MSRQMYWDEEAHQFFPVDDVPQEPVKFTNADSLRTMTDDELASLLSPVCVRGLVIEHGECDKEDKSFCVDCWLDWLKKEVKE